jgi:hypothetical protein
MKRRTLKLTRVVAAALLCAAIVTNASSQPGRSIDVNALAARGEALSNEDPLALELRNQQPEEARRGFDIGMGVADGHTAPGPGKARICASLLPSEQPSCSLAVLFSVDRNRNANRASVGAAIARVDSVIAEARDSTTDVFYRLGFDIATGIFGDPALGAQGNTATGPGSLGIRDSLSAAGKRGFNDSVALNLSRRVGTARTGPSEPRITDDRFGSGRGPVTKSEAGRKATIPGTTPAAEEPEYRELRCRGSSAMQIKVGEWYPSSAGEPRMKMVVNFNLVDKPTDRWGTNLRPGACAYADRPGTILGVSELHQVIVAFGQLKQKLNGSAVDTSPTAAERFPDAQNVPEYLKDSDHYWSFFVKYTGQGYFEASHGSSWKPSRKISPSEIDKGIRIVPQ